MAGALLDVVTAEILLRQDDTYVAETTFTTADREIEGQFMVMPSEELLDVLLKSSRAA
jgi:chemotaxis protein CheY-P-specific phosphatase CheC